MTEYLINQMILLLFSVFRMVPVFLASSLSPIARFPMIVRITVMLVLGLLALPYVNPDLAQFKEFNIYAFLRLIGSELLIGLSFSFGLQAALAGVLTLGKMVDIQIGFGASGVFDPNTNASESIVGMMMLMLVSLLMFTTNFHHILISFLIASYQFTPIGQQILELNVALLVTTISVHFFLALILFLPVIVALLMVDFLIALTAKTMPQMNIYFVGLPIKIAIGLLTLSLSVSYMLGPIESIFIQTKVFWEGLVL